MPQFWAGFVDGVLDTREIDTGWGGFGGEINKVGRTRAPMLFTSRKDARNRYSDVRKVEVRVVNKPKSGKRRR